MAIFPDEDKVCKSCGQKVTFGWEITLTFLNWNKEKIQTLKSWEKSIQLFVQSTFINV